VARVLCKWLGSAGVVGVGLAWSPPAFAIGETVEGFPSLAERIFHQRINIVRADPQAELECSPPTCAEKACYAPEPPLYYKRELNRAARFHSDEMVKQKFFSHPSICTVVPNIAELYPKSCDGSASCACVGGVSTCNPTCTGHQQRVKLFGTDYKLGEIIASGGDGMALWLNESSSTSECKFTSQNGHRWVLLKSGPAVGFGIAGSTSTGEFATGGEVNKIASGVASATFGGFGGEVEYWASYHDTAPPSSASVNIDGECYPMKLEVGTAASGAYRAAPSISNSCPRYFFRFTDSTGAVVTYPTTGSLTLPDCADEWSSARPASGASCNCVSDCDGSAGSPDSGTAGGGGSGAIGSGGQGANGGSGAGSSGGGSGGSSSGIGAKSGSADSGTKNDADGSDDDGGCGCRIEGSRATEQSGLAGAIVGIVFAVGGLSKRRSGFRRR